VFASYPLVKTEKFMSPLLQKGAIIAIFSLTLAACSLNPMSKAAEPAFTKVKSASSTGDKQMMNNDNMGSMSGGKMNMHLGPADAQYDLRFIDAMTPHHLGAIEMATDALSKSQRPEIKQLARNIITAQNREIKQMKQWRQAWYPKASTTSVADNPEWSNTMAMSKTQMQGMMMRGNLGSANAQYDLRFINMMIPHHQGAIVMATDALAKSQRPEIKKLAQSIITSQQQEIAQMQQWRRQWYQQ